MVINTNVSASNAASLLGQSSSALSKSLARLSSGSKITSPADDSAGLAVSMKLGAQISRTAAAAANVGNATSYSQTQDGYLQKIGDALNRMSELTVAAQDVTKTDSDRKLYNQEFQSLASYINEAVTKDFNGVSLFSGSALNVTTDSEGGTFAMQSISGNYVAVGVTTTTTTTSNVGYAANTQLARINPAISNPSSVSAWSGSDAIQVENSTTVPVSNATMPPTSTISDLVNFLNSTGGDSSASYNSSTGQLSLTAAPGFSFYDYGKRIFTNLGLPCPVLASGGDGVNNLSGSAPLTISTTLTHSVTTSTTTTTPSAGSLDISSVSGAKSALTTIKNSINQLASDRAIVGSNLTRLNYTSDQLGSLQNNLAAAKSRITDVDVAQESTNYAKASILVQSGTAMLAQANALPQSVLKLLG